MPVATSEDLNKRDSLGNAVSVWLLAHRCGGFYCSVIQELGVQGTV